MIQMITALKPRQGRERCPALDRAEEIRLQSQPCHDLRGFGQLAQPVFRHPSASRGIPCGTRACVPVLPGSPWPRDGGHGGGPPAPIPNADGLLEVALGR